MEFEVVDIVFPLKGRTSLPPAYSYALYAALARRLPIIHESEYVGIFPLNGDYTDGRILLRSRSALRIRAHTDLLPQIITLTGQRIEVDGAVIHVGVPRVVPLRPAPTLYSRFVQIKLADNSGGVNPSAFLESVHKQLLALGIEASAAIPVWKDGPHAGEPKRRVVQIKGERHVGYALLVEGLTAEESLRLQQHGLGGRRKMGCGLFLPVRW